MVLVWTSEIQESRHLVTSVPSLFKTDKPPVSYTTHKDKERHVMEQSLLLSSWAFFFFLLFLILGNKLQAEEFSTGGRGRKPIRAIILLLRSLYWTVYKCAFYIQYCPESPQLSASLSLYSSKACLCLALWLSLTHTHPKCLHPPPTPNQSHVTPYLSRCFNGPLW